MILQKDCCIDCILVRIDAGLQMMNEELLSNRPALEATSPKASIHICIIAGGVNNSEKDNAANPKREIPAVFDAESQGELPGFGLEWLRCP